MNTKKSPSSERDVLSDRRVEKGGGTVMAAERYVTLACPFSVLHYYFGTGFWGLRAGCVSLGALPHPWSNASRLPSFTPSRQAPPPDVHLSRPLLNPMRDSSLLSPLTTNGTGTTRARSAKIAKRKKGILGFVLNLLGLNKRVKFSTPHDPVHLTHVGFNARTGEFIGLPKEWQQLLQESGISRTEQEKNPEAVRGIVKFYQEGGGGDVWDKMGGALKGGPPVVPAPPASKPLMDESFYAPVCRLNSPIPIFG